MLVIMSKRLKIDLDGTESKIISHDLILSEHELMIEKNNSNLNKLELELIQTKNLISNNETVPKQDFDRLVESHNQILKRNAQFKKSIVYPLFIFTHNFGKTKLGQILQKLLK